MNREFLDLYNQELQLLKEQGKEFAEEYPEIAERLGGLLAERTDPMVSGLLEGAAFLAARVQLKLQHEFPEFTHNLLEQLAPNYLAPTPSVMMVKAQPKFGDAMLREGVKLPRGAYLNAQFQEMGRPVSCRYRLTADLTMWPFEIQSAEYFTSPAALQALKIPVGSEVLSGLRICLAHRFAESRAIETQDPGADRKPEFWFSGCRTDTLPIHFVGAEADCDSLYEHVFAHRVGLHFRYLDESGDPVVINGGADQVRQIGFDDDEALFDNENRIFSGFELLREYFLFSRKFLGFRLNNLAPVMTRLNARSVEIIMTFREINVRLAASVQAPMFALYAQPAINLFEMTTDRVPVKSNQHEFHIVPDRSRYLDFEPHHILQVYAHKRGNQERVPAYPLYSPKAEAQRGAQPLSFTIRRLPRKHSQSEKERARHTEYAGVDMFIALSQPNQDLDKDDIAELSVKAVCSNRHLPELMPTGPGGADIRLRDNAEIVLVCVAGPTRPRESVVSQKRSSSETISTGAVAWRLINLLSLNHLGLVERGAGGNAQALREILGTFAFSSDQAVERRLRGLLQVVAKPAVRRLRRPGGNGVARGTEIRVLVDEKAFEGWGVFLLGAILDRFFCEYAGFNHFTETVIVGNERGEVMRWPARTGLRRSL